jgi:hypothetical protein
VAMSGLTGGETRYLDRQIETISAFEAWLALGSYAPNYVVFHCIRRLSRTPWILRWRSPA